MCIQLPLNDITSIKFHTNSWGMGSNNLMAEQMVPKMKKLTHIDMSDTIKFPRRSDLCMGIRAWLRAARNFEIVSINLA